MKIIIELNPYNTEENRALVQLLSSIHSDVVEPDAIPPTKTAKAPVAKAPVAKAPVAKAPEVEPTVTVSEIRKKVATLTEEHRKTIKEKLTELGAKNVTTLEPSNYDAFYEFLEAL